jgi:hypothetical protein
MQLATSGRRLEPAGTSSEDYSSSLRSPAESEQPKVRSIFKEMRLEALSN